MQVENAVGIARGRDRQITAPKFGRNWGWHQNLFPEVLHLDPCFPVQQQHAPKASIGPSVLQDHKGVRGRDRKEALTASEDTGMSGKPTSRRYTHWRQVDVAARESRDSALSVQACRWKCSLSPGSPPHTLTRDSPLSLCFPSSTIVCSPSRARARLGLLLSARLIVVEPEDAPKRSQSRNARQVWRRCFDGIGLVGRHVRRGWL